MKQTICLALVSAVVVAAGGAGQPASVLDPFYEQSVAWTACGTAEIPRECASVMVPLDWSRPDGPALSLAVSRHRATGRRLGSLLLNPGGPGASGVDFVSQAAAVFGADLVASFDLVSWDPRGVGESSPLTCPADADAGLARVDPSPDTVAERRAMEAATTRWATACRQASGPIFDHVDTLSTARDLDVLRAVVGQPKLVYAGFSYGTRIGLFYADLFPARVGRMSLDSSVDPASDGRTFFEGQAVGAERGLDDYLAGCADRTGCPLAGEPVTRARDRIEDLVRAADAEPLDQAELINVMVGGITRPEAYPGLDDFLTARLNGDPDTASGAAFDITNAAINCLDLPDRRDADQVMAGAARTARAAPVFGNELTSSTVCPQWPAPAQAHPHPVTGSGASPILVVGTTRDPATPYEWAQTAASNLDSGRLLTRVGSGHVAYTHSTCVTAAVDRYFIAGELPAVGATCAD